MGMLFMNPKDRMDRTGVLSSAFLALLLVGSVSMNVYQYTEQSQAKRFVPNEIASIAPGTLTRDVLSAERMGNMDHKTYDYTYAHGLRKNMLFTSNNCVAEECFFVEEGGATLTESERSTVLGLQDRMDALGTSLEGYANAQQMALGAVANMHSARLRSIADMGAVDMAEELSACSDDYATVVDALQFLDGTKDKEGIRDDVHNALHQVQISLETVFEPFLEACK